MEQTKKILAEIKLYKIAIVVLLAMAAFSLWMGAIGLMFYCVIGMLICIGLMEMRKEELRKGGDE